jgi:peptidoglycan/xylan/chitin deacetylase (PgdA/CDA1 family)
MPDTDRTTSIVATEARFLSSEPEVHRAFAEALLHDQQSARLSTLMRRYYQLRPLVPIAARRFLQGRKGNAVYPTRPFFPDDFQAALSASLAAHPEGTPLIHPWPDGADWAFVLTHDVESEAGLAHALRLADIELEYGFRSSWNIVPHGYRVDMGVVAALRDRGCEIGVHGYNHDGRLFSSRRVFEKRAVAINRALADFGAVGFRAPMVHRNLDWLQQLDVTYDASYFDKDPYQAMPGGVGAAWPFIAGKIVELPYTMPQDHTLLVMLGETSDRIWREKLSWLLRQHGMALMLTHPDYLLSDSHLDLYRGFLEHVCETGGYWHALPREVAAWWRDRDESRLQKQENGEWQVDGAAAERASVATLAADERGISFTRHAVGTVG